MERVDVDKVKVTALKETGVSADDVRKEDAELSAAEDAEDLRKDCRLVLSLCKTPLHHCSSSASWSCCWS